MTVAPIGIPVEKHTNMPLTINNVRFDDPQRCYIIAEMSGGHQQDYDVAERLVTSAAEAGADAVKIQTFSPEDICADIPLPFGYDAKHDAWLRSLGVTRMRELFAIGGFPRAWTPGLKRHAERCGVELISTPFSVDAARWLVEEIGVKAIKIASGDLTFTPLLEYAASTGLPMLVSTGGATHEEVYESYRIICRAMDQQYIQDRIDSDVSVAFFHCVSAYPCPNTAANLRAIHSVQSACGYFPVGFSDHTLSIDLVPALAIAMGATIYEKHIRLDGDNFSVDAHHSLTPSQFKAMVQTMANVPSILGNGKKVPHPLEMHDRLWARRDPHDWLRPTQAARQGRWE